MIESKSLMENRNSKSMSLASPNSSESTFAISLFSFFRFNMFKFVFLQLRFAWLSCFQILTKIEKKQMYVLRLSFILWLFFFHRIDFFNKWESVWKDWIKIDYKKRFNEKANNKSKTSFYMLFSFYNTLKEFVFLSLSLCDYSHFLCYFVIKIRKEKKTLSVC